MKLTVQPSEFGLEEAKAKELIKDLAVTLKEREILKEAFLDVSELEVTEENIPTFKELRLKIVKNRTQGIEKWHKAQKAFYLAGGRFVDAIKNKEIAVNQEMEEKLMDAEKHFENLEKERIEKIQLDRASQLEKYVDDISHIDLGNMDDEIWEAYYAANKKEYEDRIEAEKKAEAERLERERLDKIEHQRRMEIGPYLQFIDDGAPELRDLSDKEFSSLMDELKKAKASYDAEQEKIRKENERLKKEREYEQKRVEAEEKRVKKERLSRKESAIKFLTSIGFKVTDSGLENKEHNHFIGEYHYSLLDSEEELESFKQEQKKIHDKNVELKKEREARQKLEAEAAKRKADEEKAEAERIELAKAPIKKQLNAWVNSFELPGTGVDNEATKEIIAKFEAFKKWSINQVNNL